MDEFMGVIKIFGGNFAPQGWLTCNGQLLSIAQYSALYSLLGTTYGGDGQTTFGLPDLRSRIPVGGGQGASPGLQPIALGQMAGEENHTLINGEMPAHTHNAYVNNTNATQAVANSSSLMAAPGDSSSSTFVPTNGYNTANTDTQLNNNTVSFAGSNIPHDNIQPYLALNFIICVEGLFPSRS